MYPADTPVLLGVELHLLDESVCFSGKGHRLTGSHHDRDRRVESFALLQLPDEFSSNNVRVSSSQRIWRGEFLTQRVDDRTELLQ